MKFEAEMRSPSDLIDQCNELIVCDRNGTVLRTIDRLVILGGETVREAIEAEVNPGEQVLVRRKAMSARSEP
ncbi:MAG: hypothetical protein ACT4PS_13225 [Betaproteobacteria bacterium]